MHTITWAGKTSKSTPKWINQTIQPSDNHDHYDHDHYDEDHDDHYHDDDDNEDDDDDGKLHVHSCRKLSSIGSRFTDHKLPIKFSSAQFSQYSTL